MIIIHGQTVSKIRDQEEALDCTHWIIRFGRGYDFSQERLRDK